MLARIIAPRIIEIGAGARERASTVLKQLGLYRPQEIVLRRPALHGTRWFYLLHGEQERGQHLVYGQRSPGQGEHLGRNHDPRAMSERDTRNGLAAEAGRA